MLHKHENIDAQTTQALHSRFLGIPSEMIIAWLLKKNNNYFGSRCQQSEAVAGVHLGQRTWLIWRALSL